MPALPRRPPPRPANPGLVRGWDSASVKCQCVPAAWLLDLSPGAWCNQSSQADLARVAEQGPEANGWTDGQMDGRMDGWTRVHAGSSRGSGEPSILRSAHPHSGEGGSQGKEVRQGCPRNTEPALGTGPLGRWTPTTTPALPNELPGGGLEGRTQNIGLTGGTRGPQRGEGCPRPHREVGPSHTWE